MRTNASWTLLAALLAASAACGPAGRRAEIPASWLWDQDQTLITAERGSRNAWSGWTVREGSFEAEGAAAKFILWARTAEHETAAHHLLPGRKARRVHRQ